MGSSIVAIMLQLLGLPISNFINPVVPTNLEATVLYAQVLDLVPADQKMVGSSIVAIMLQLLELPSLILSTR